MSYSTPNYEVPILIGAILVVSAFLILGSAYTTPSDSERAEKRAYVSEMAKKWGLDMGLKVVKSDCVSYSGSEYRCTLSVEDGTRLNLIPVLCWVGKDATCHVSGKEG
jgi:hypothetical protein